MSEIIKVIITGVFLLIEGIRDIKTRQISMVSVCFFAILGMVLCVVFDIEKWYQPVIGAMPGLFILFLAKITKERIGYGDGWVILVTGIYLGFRYNLFLLTMSLFLSAIVSVVLLMFKRVHRKSSMPFVAFVFAGYCIMLTGVI